VERPAAPLALAAQRPDRTPRALLRRSGLVAPLRGAVSLAARLVPAAPRLVPVVVRAPPRHLVPAAPLLEAVNPAARLALAVRLQAPVVVRVPRRRSAQAAHPPAVASPRALLAQVAALPVHRAKSMAKARRTALPARPKKMAHRADLNTGRKLIASAPIWRTRHDLGIILT